MHVCDIYINVIVDSCLCFLYAINQASMKRWKIRIFLKGVNMKPIDPYSTYCFRYGDNSWAVKGIWILQEELYVNRSCKGRLSSESQLQSEK